MYIFTLVDDVGKVIETLRKQHGEFMLAMLYNSALEAESGWNLIVSAPWTDAMGAAEATRLIARVLNESLGLENKQAISRITVLRTSDPFVRDMIKLYAVRSGSRVPLSQVTAGEVTEGSGFILYSQKVA
jgi:hypothetical protein